MELRIEDGNILLCPHCGGNNLHHTAVAVYERAEDAEELTRTVVTDNGAIVQRIPSVKSGNPSSRRHGLRIEFVCENGCEESFLTIAQHKGCTLIEMEK